MPTLQNFSPLFRGRRPFFDDYQKFSMRRVPNRGTRPMPGGRGARYILWPDGCGCVRLTRKVEVVPVGFEHFPCCPVAVGHGGEL